ncbi:MULTISPECIES: DUF5932 domain-containing protein [unclassified Maribacter]|uniref:DUF5932 domain-containing protein n=1 Tax=unclassified Maribacter TaxID=2615042 RepID=UPI00257BC3B5|nr:MULTISPECIES: DUF5932 domain-containing protein [unclassified Maribacter]|tara:strand:- start:116716 stop:117393 length:678 start_codon:yes stop_codon:yes gene_type:complete
MPAYKIIIVEDEPFLSDAYKLVFRILNEDSFDNSYSVSTANTYEQGVAIIHKCSFNQDDNLIAILDIRILSNDGGFKKTGEDLALLLKSLRPDSKIIIVTSLVKKYYYHSIVTKVNPQGFLIKSEMDFNKLKLAINRIINGETYFTKSISDFFRRSAVLNLPIDEYDRKLLFHLSEGCTIKEMSEILNLSISGIEWRQRKLSRIFNLENVRIKSLLQKATEFGLI